MQEILNDGTIHLVLGPMFHWRMSSTDDRIEQGFVRGKTRWATSSSRLATLLAREDAGENRQVRLIGQNGRIAGAMYSPRLVREALNTLGKLLVDDGRLVSVSLFSGGPTADFPELDTQDWQEDDYDQQGKLVDPVKVKEGKREEIDWVLKQKLFDLRSSERMCGTARPTLLTEMGSGEGWCGVVWCGVVWCGVVWCGVVWCGVCGVVWCGVVWCVCGRGGGGGGCGVWCVVLVCCCGFRRFFQHCVFVHIDGR